MSKQILRSVVLTGTVTAGLLIGGPEDEMAAVRALRYGRTADEMLAFPAHGCGKRKKNSAEAVSTMFSFHKQMNNDDIISMDLINIFLYGTLLKTIIQI